MVINNDFLNLLFYKNLNIFYYKVTLTTVKICQWVVINYIEHDNL